jgi:hypothetical protein
VLEVMLDGGGGAVLICPLGGGGGGGGHMANPVSGGSCPASLALILHARVLVGRPRGLIRIHVVYLYVGRVGGESGTDMTLTSPSSSSSSATATSTMSSSSATMTSTTSSTSVTPSSPSLIPGGDNTGCLCAIGYGHGPIPWMAQGGSRRLLREVAGSEGSISQ